VLCWRMVTDASGLTMECMQTITVIDNTPPVLTCGENQRLVCNAPVVFDEPVATDNCDPAPVIGLRTSAISQGPGPCDTTHSRGWVAVDACGNESEPCFQTIIGTVDTEPPVVTCGPGGRVPCNEPVVYPDPVITDNCDPDPEVRAISTVYPGPGRCEETYEACWEAEDACGNVSESCCITIIRTLDTESPVITYCPPSDTFDCAVNIDELPHAEAEDNCDDDLTVEYSSHVLQACEPTCEIIYVRTWVFIDDCFNEARCEQYVTVVDDERPSLCCAPHKIVECDEEVVFTEPIATDNCDPDVEVRVILDWVFPWCGGCDDGDDCDHMSVGPAMVDEVMGQLDLDDADGPDNLVSCPDDDACVCIFKEIHIRCWKAVDDCGLSSRCCQFIFVRACPDTGGGCDDTEPAEGDHEAPPALSSGNIEMELLVRSHPNPLNGSTTISYALPTEGEVTIAIFDVQGRRVTTLLDVRKSPGIHALI
jgi:hypothetical protein